MAAALNEKPDTVLRWRIRRRIPEPQIVRVAELLERKGVKVSALDLLRLNTPMEKRGWPAGKKRKQRKGARK